MLNRFTPGLGAELMGKTVNLIIEVLEEKVGLFIDLIPGCMVAHCVSLLSPLLLRQRGSDRLPVQTGRAYAYLIRAYGMNQDLEGARIAWQDMHERNVKPVKRPSDT